MRTGSSSSTGAISCLTRTTVTSPREVITPRFFNCFSPGSSRTNRTTRWSRRPKSSTAKPEDRSAMAHTIFMQSFVHEMKNRFPQPLLGAVGSVQNSANGFSDFPLLNEAAKTIHGYYVYNGFAVYLEVLANALAWLQEQGFVDENLR